MKKLTKLRLKDMKTNIEKHTMNHEEVLSLLHEGYDMPRGWKSGKNQPLWHQKVYDMWRKMWIRCYVSTSPSYKYYIDSIIHDDFRIFSNYLKWIQAQPRFEEFCSTCHEITWSVDKDMVYPGNRHYFPEYMTLCTMSENSKDSAHRNKDNLHHLSRNDAIKGAKVQYKPIIGISLTNNNILIYKYTRQAKHDGFDPGAIIKCCKGKWQHYKGYKWYYLDMNDRR